MSFGWRKIILTNRVRLVISLLVVSLFRANQLCSNQKLSLTARTQNAPVYIQNCYILTFDPAPQKMLFQGDAPEGSDTFQWPVIERDRVGGLRLIIWDKVKVPLCQYRLMHRKRVTSELHGSYFRLMTIKHSISKIQWAIVWALNYYLTQLSSSPRSSC